MTSSLLSVLVLVLGYFLYGSFLERVFRADKTPSAPANRLADGVDFVVMPNWKVFLITVYLSNLNKNHWISLLPAVLMTMVCSSYIFIAPESFQLSHEISYGLGAAVTIAATASFIALRYRKQRPSLAN